MRTPITGVPLSERRDTIFISRDRKILQSAGRDFYRRDGPSLLSLSSRLHLYSYLYEKGMKRKFSELLSARLKVSIGDGGLHN